MMKKEETKKTEETPKKTSAAKARLNPYEGYTISATIRGRKFYHRGNDYDANNLTPSQLDRLAKDEKFKHVTKKTN